MSRLALPLLLAVTLLLFQGAAGAEETSPESRASIQVLSPRPTVYVGEVVPLTLEIRHDRPWFQAHATPLFRQPMDIPVRALVPAFLPLEGLQPLASPDKSRLSDGLSFALGDEVVWPTTFGGIRSAAGWVRLNLLLTRRFLATKPGTITAAAPTLEFAWAERFETDLLGVRTPVDPQRVTLTGTESRLTVLPVPTESRPPEWQGLIGRYTLGASTDRSELAVGEPLRLTLSLVGEGNHETLPIPGFEGLGGFHLLGTLDEQTPKLRTLHIDLTPLDTSTREIPALTLAFFDPERGAYDVARSESVPLTVSGASAPPAPTPPETRELATSRGWLLPVALGLLALLGAGLVLRRRRARTQRSTEPVAQREALLARLRAAARTPEGGPALIDVLAWQLSAAPAAVVAPDLALRLERSGLPAGLAERAAAAVEAGVAARYAGSHAVSAALPPELVADLEQALRTPLAL